MASLSGMNPFTVIPAEPFDPALGLVVYNGVHDIVSI
jgi:hypothetical protein